MDNQLLKDRDVFPSEEVLKNALGGVWQVYEAFVEIVTGPEYGLAAEWNYYNDGKSWLCKVVCKKKTVFWLSVWEGYFKTSIFFTEKHLESIAALDISEKIKEDFYMQKPVGRLLPMLLDIRRKEQLPDLLKLVAFKKTAK